MTDLQTLTITIEASDAALSVRSVLESWIALGEVLQLSVDLADGGIIPGLDGRDLFRCEPVDPAAVGAGKLCSLQINPCDRYLEFAAAVARRAECDIVFRHGWPILSLGSSPPSVAEAGGETISARGGAA